MNLYILIAACSILCSAGAKGNKLFNDVVEESVIETNKEFCQKAIDEDNAFLKRIYCNKKVRGSFCSPGVRFTIDESKKDAALAGGERVFSLDIGNIVHRWYPMVVELHREPEPAKFKTTETAVEVEGAK